MSGVLPKPKDCAPGTVTYEWYLLWTTAAVDSVYAKVGRITWIERVNGADNLPHTEQN